MEVRQLELFLAVMDHTSVTRAAEKAGLSPGAVSLQLHNLAAELRTELFVRSGKCEPAAAIAWQWTRSHPSCARAWVAWAKLNLLAGELASAKTALTRALKIDPADALVQNALKSLS